MRYFIALLAFCVPSTATLPPTFPAEKFTTPISAYQKSLSFNVLVPYAGPDGDADKIFLTRLDLVGDSKERGEAHSYLAADDIVELFDVKLQEYFKDEVLDIDISSLPLALQAIMEPILEKGR